MEWRTVGQNLTGLNRSFCLELSLRFIGATSTEWLKPWREILALTFDHCEVGFFQHVPTLLLT